MKIVITGGNEGIGYHLASELLRLGNTVGVLDINITNLDTLSKQYSDTFLPISCDVRDDDAVKCAIDHFVNTYGNIDIAVHNACNCSFEPMDKIEEKTYHSIFDVNYYGALRLTKAVIPYMESAGHGKVIFTSSGVGITGFANISPYASSKGALESLAKCLSIEYKDKKISFHLFHPPLTKTKSSAPLPVPPEIMAEPNKIGIGLAHKITKKSFVICHSITQRIQLLLCYLFPLKMGNLMSYMTQNFNK